MWYWTHAPTETKNMNYYAKDLTDETFLTISKIVNCGNTIYCGYEKDDNDEFKKDANGSKIRCEDCPPNGLTDRKEKFDNFKEKIKCP